MTLRLVVFGLMLVVGGCLERPGEPCWTGLVCPGGTTCNAAGDRCIAPNQRAHVSRCARNSVELRQGPPTTRGCPPST